jgi:anti-sigma factor RsiW
MHQVIVEGLEEYMGGRLAAGARRDFEAHLEICSDCRREVSSMMEMSDLFGSLRSSEEIAAPPGFYARVVAEVSTARGQSFWNLFSLDAAFGRRVIFASLVTLAVLGSFLVSRETGYARGPVSPEAVMAQHDSTSRDTMLVTLTSYEP